MILGQPSSDFAALPRIICISHCVVVAGMLLRFFVNFYNMEVIEEEAFLKWKEDISDEHPGKGKALFQVRS